MKKLTTLFVLCLFISTVQESSALSLKFENKSKWEVHELYFSSSDEDDWGPDQLGEEVIETGDTFTLTKIAKGNYDVKIVDEDGDNCEVPDVDFSSSEHFVLTDKILLGCQSETDQG